MNASITAGAGGRNKVVGLICAGHFYSHFASLVMPPLFALLIPEFGVGFLELSYIVAAFSVATSAGQVPVGFLVDRFGARTVLLLGLGLMGASTALIGVVDAFWLVVVLSGFAGLGNSVFHPADYAIMSARIEEGVLGRAMGVHSFSGYVGWAAAPPAMLLMADAMGWRAAVVAAGLFGVAIAIVMWVNASLLDYELDEQPAAEPGRRPVSSMRRSIDLMCSTPMLMMFIFYFLTSIAITGAASFAVVAVSQLHETSLIEAGYALTSFMIAMALGVLLGGVWADRTTDHKMVTSVALVGAAIFLALISIAGMPLWLVMSVLVAGGLLYGSTSPSRDLLVRAATPPGQIGLAFGFTSTGMGVGNAAGPVALGWLMDAGRPDLVFVAIGAITAVAILTVVMTRPIQDRAHA